MKNNKVSILYVDPFFDLGGQEIHLLNIIKGLNRDNFVIHIACPKKNALIHELRNIKNITFLHISMTRKFDLISIIKLWYYIINNHIDIVHMNGSRAGLIGRIASIFTNSKIVFLAGSATVPWSPCMQLDFQWHSAREIVCQSFQLGGSVLIMHVKLGFS